MKKGDLGGFKNLQTEGIYGKRYRAWTARTKKTYVLELKKGPHHLATYIDKADADKCMEGVECIHLGVQIGQFLENFKTV